MGFMSKDDLDTLANKVERDNRKAIQLAVRQGLSSCYDYTPLRINAGFNGDSAILVGATSGYDIDESVLELLPLSPRGVIRGGRMIVSDEPLKIPIESIWQYSLLTPDLKLLCVDSLTLGDGLKSIQEGKPLQVFCSIDERTESVVGMYKGYVNGKVVLDNYAFNPLESFPARGDRVCLELNDIVGYNTLDEVGSVPSIYFVNLKNGTR